MNVLILTPDAVGSTLLQRMLTIYMQFHQFDKPVINLHELTNGLEKYWSPEFNRELVNKKNVKNWSYYQTLEQVVDILSSVDHYKTSRLAHYHLVNRDDPLSQQIPFYQYLNDNFFIIACQRSNVFEHALSMTLNRVTKKLNVYTAWEKIQSFYEIYRNGVNLDPEVFQQQLEAYRRYVDWSHQYFKVAQYFHYEQHVPQLEKFILNLPFMKNQTRQISWKDNFGIDFNEWNKIHYARSDVTALLQSPLKPAQQLLAHDTAVSDYQQHAPNDWPAVFSTADITSLPHDLQDTHMIDFVHRHGVVTLLDAASQSFINQNRAHYVTATDTIAKMVELGIVVSPPPIKKQTLQEKQNIISNFAPLCEIYNHWAEQNPGIAKPLADNDIQQQNQIEQDFWRTWPSASIASHVVLPTVT